MKLNTKIFLKTTGHMFRIKIILISVLFWCCCMNTVSAQTEILNDAVKNVTKAIVYDVFSAPAASRIYAYSTIAAYEVMQMGIEEYHSFENDINQFPSLPTPENDMEINYELAGIYALYYTAKSFLFSEETILFHITALRIRYAFLESEKVNRDSELYGKLVAEKIISWSESDGFTHIRSLPRYALIEKEGSWTPTPPDYADASEPYWGKLRTFVLDSATAVKPQACLVFSIDSNSLFYRNALDVYKIGNQLTEEQKMIALFWDDNPFTTKYIGHMQYAEKKFSPAGHWLDITRVAIELSKTDIIKAAQIYAVVSMTNADAFISCWAEKYTSNLLRPETYINKYIDAQWKPFLQTPPFPEYTSGHSTISSASATILTYYFGSGFVFTDSSETIYDLPPRTFGSFAWAANEASISRVYGGIHFKKSVEQGSNQGYDIGVHTLLILFKKD